MNPKKSGAFIDSTAEELQCDKKLVKDLVDFYWIDVRKALTEMRYHTIYIHNLGTFKVKHWRLVEMIEKFDGHIKNENHNTFQKMAIKKEVEKRLIRVQNLQALMLVEHKRKATIKAIRNEKRNNGSLPSSQTDI